MPSQLRERNRQLTEVVQRQNQELAALSRTDPLTGLANRRQTEDALAAELLAWALLFALQHRYAGWPARRKLEYMDQLMGSIASNPISASYLCALPNRRFTASEMCSKFRPSMR